MGRIYSAVFEAVSVSAAQDLFEVIAPAGMILRVWRINVSQEASETSEQLPFTIKLATGSYTTGTGGTTVTPARHNPNDPASSVTAKVNNTTRALVGTGALVTVYRGGDNALNKFIEMPVPEALYGVPPSGAVIVGLEAAPAAALTVSGVLTFEELP